MNNKIKRSSPSSEQRAELQKLRILKAARTCFIQDGLHAGTIARISETAQMSPGLIYRYFSSREEIVLGLMRLQVKAGFGPGIAGLTPKVVTARICEYLRRWLAGDPDVPSPPLILEMSAESTRNEAIAKHVVDADKEARASLIAWLTDLSTQAGETVSEKEIQIRAMALGCFIDGLVLRAAREPDLDMEIVEKSMDSLMAMVAPSPPRKAT